MFMEELSLAGHVLLAAILGALIGLERERFVGLAGIRTYATVSLGACLFGLISLHVMQPADLSRIAAQIVSGIGFLGAGVIMRDKGRVRGLTTAATLWATASVGLAVANAMYILSVCTTILIIGILALHRVPGWLPWKYQNFPERDED